MAKYHQDANRGIVKPHAKDYVSAAFCATNADMVANRRKTNLAVGKTIAKMPKGSAAGAIPDPTSPMAVEPRARREVEKANTACRGKATPKINR